MSTVGDDLELVHRARDVVVAASWGAGPLAAAVGARAPTTWEPLHMNVTEPAEYRVHHLVQHAERPITLKQFPSGQIVVGDPPVGLKLAQDCVIDRIHSR